jgi:pimeloyl-ACP methyl ester carboxylesterase
VIAAATPASAPPPTLACRRLGEGKPLVLLHGGVGSWRHWEANLPELSRHFTVIAVDLLGYGDSDDVPPGTDDEAYIALVAQSMDAVLPQAPAGLVAFSFGAVVAAAIAARMPDAFDRVSLLAPAGFGVPTGRALETRRVPPGGPDKPEVREAVAYNLGQWMLSSVPPCDDAVVDLQLANMARARFDSRRISLQDRLATDLARVRAPVQLIWGEQDRLAFPSVAERVERCRAAADIAHVSIIPAAGHWVQYEARETVDQLLIDFHCG